MRNRRTDETGLAGKILVGVIAWALGAVIMLTSTLVAAQQIDDRVATIVGEVSPIDDDLDSVKLVEETNRLADEILAAAKPLSAQAGQVIEASTSIDASAKSIDTHVGEIGASVDGIHASAGAINATAREINGTVKEINATAQGINRDVRSIDRAAAEINGSVHSIDERLSAVLATARSIAGERDVNDGFGSGVTAINRRADAIIAIVHAIKADTANILSVVGSIDKTAKSIDQKSGNFALS